MIINPLSKCNIDITQFRYIIKIKEGGFGKIYKVENINTKEICAAKIIKFDGKDYTKKIIDREIGIMMSVNNPTLIKIKGYSLCDIKNKPNITILMDLAKNGSLDEFLYNIRLGLEPTEYTGTLRLIFLIGIARGMKYLHDRNIIHRDLSTSNILLDDNFHPIITDFGMSKYLENENSKNNSSFFGKYQYMAPEVIDHQKYDQKSDVYSFAIIMYEIVTDDMPYPDYVNQKLNDFQFAGKVTKENYRPIFEKPIKKSSKNLIERCWSNEPNERPSFNEIYKELINNENGGILDNVNFDEIEMYIDEITEINDPFEELINKIEIITDEKEQLSLELNTKTYLLDNQIQINKKLKTKNKRIKNKNDELKLINENLMQDLHCKENDLQNQIDINKDLRTENNTIKNKNDELQLINENLIQNLNNKDCELENQIEINKDLKTENNELQLISKKYKQDLNNKEKELKNQIDFYEESKKNLFENLYGIDVFNHLPLNTQLSIIDELLLNTKNDEQIKFYKNLSALYNFIQIDQSKESKCIKIISNNKNRPLSDFHNEFQILILASSAKTFFLNESIKSNIFIDNLKSLDNIIIELNYPKKSFSKLYQSVLNLQNEMTDKNHIKISVFISGITEINKQFNSMESINIIRMDNCVTSIGKKSFEKCKSLEQIMIPSTLRSIGAGSFSNCSSLKTITIPPIVSTIESNTFFGCTSLSEIIVPESVNSIGSNSFCGCSSLSKIIIQSSIKSIEPNTFNGCSSLCKINIPLSVESIGSKAFNGCSSLKRIIVPESVNFIGSNAFCGCSSLKQIIIPESVNFIGSNAFYGCSSLSKIIIQALIKSIEPNTFSGCSSLCKINIPSSVESIGSKAFDSCSSLEQILIPSSVRNVGEYCFKKCTKLEQISIDLKNTSIYYNSFIDCPLFNRLTIRSYDTNYLIQFTHFTVKTNDIDVFFGTNVDQKLFNEQKIEFQIKFLNIIKQMNQNVSNYYIQKVINILSFLFDEFQNSISNLFYIDFETNKESFLIKWELTNILYSQKKIDEQEFISLLKNLNCAIFEIKYLSEDNNDTFQIIDAINNIKKYVNCSIKINLLINDIKEINQEFKQNKIINNIILDSKVSQIGKESFMECSCLEQVTIPSSVNSIKKRAFTDCKSLKNITIPYFVFSIGSSAFSGCSSLVKISIPKSVSIIKPYTFSRCSLLKQIFIPNSVTKIGSFAFMGCSSLIELILPSSVTNIGSSAFYGCSSLTKISIPSSVTMIGVATFYGCSSLIQISIPSSLNSIESSTFEGCTSLKKVIIPTSVSSIESFAFNGCCSLIDISIPSSVISIESSAFQGCPLLTSNQLSIHSKKQIKRF